MIEGGPNEITFIFHSNKEEDRKMRAFVEAIDGFEVNELDLNSEKLTEEELAGVANKLDVDIVDLFDPVCADRLNILIKDLRKQDALKMLAQDPILLSTPILIIGEHAYQFESSSEFISESATITGIRNNES
jgi:arsenate reductase-like glutaredoxin family protein